jgi:hypothetical protein
MLFDELSGFDSACSTPAYAHADFASARGSGFAFTSPTASRCRTEAIDRPTSTAFPADVATDRRLFDARWKLALDKQPFARQWHDRDAWHLLAVRNDLAAEVCR